MSNTKPPLGLQPRKFSMEFRAIDICAAMDRYYRAGKPIPKEWVVELVDINYALQAMVTE